MGVGGGGGNSSWQSVGIGAGVREREQTSATPPDLQDVGRERWVWGGEGGAGDNKGKRLEKGERRTCRHKEALVDVFVFEVILCFGPSLVHLYRSKSPQSGQQQITVDMGIPDLHFARKSRASPEQLTCCHLMATLELVIVQVSLIALATRKLTSSNLSKTSPFSLSTLFILDRWPKHGTGA